MKALCAIFVSLALTSIPVHSAKMRMCKDAEGNVTFTQTACPKNTTSRRNIYVAPAQAPIKGLRSGEVNELGRIRQQDHQRSQRIKQEYAQQKRQNASKQRDSAIAAREKQKKNQISQIERDMRRGAISKRAGHELINQTQSGNSSPQPQISTPTENNTTSPKFYNRVNKGYVDQRTGRFYPGNDKGFFDTESGKFVPGGKKGAFSPN